VEVVLQQAPLFGIEVVDGFDEFVVFESFISYISFIMGNRRAN